MRKFFRALGTTVFIVVVTALLVECAYRYYLSTRVAAELADWGKKFKQTERPTVAGYGVAPWVFDRAGHSFQQGPWRTALISNGVFERCESAGEGNQLGNVGWMPEDYATADLRLMIVGSSFSMVKDENGRLVDQVLMERLSKRLNRRVAVLNYSRDATGVLTYFNMARFKFEESKPHIIIALINTIALISRLEHDIGGEADKIVVNPPNDWTLRVAGTELYAKLAARSLLPIVSQLKPHKS